MHAHVMWLYTRIRHSQEQPQQPQQPKAVSCQECPFLCLCHLLRRPPAVDMVNVERAAGAAQRRRGGRLRAALRHERQSIAMALAELTHHTAPQGQRMARVGRWEREALHGDFPEQPTPQEPGTQFFDLAEGSVSELGGTRPDRLVDVRPQERVQRRTVEQLVDAAPCLPALDAPVPLVVEQLVTVLAEMEREEDAEMNRLEDRILQRAPSLPQRRRLGDAGLQRAASLCRGDRKRGRKRSFLEGTHSAKLCRRPGDSTGARVWPTFMQRQVPTVRRFRCRAVSSSTECGLPTVQTAQQTAEILQVRLLDQVVSMPVVAVQTLQPVEIPQLQFLDKVDMPVVALTGVLVRTWCRSCRSSSRNACPS